MNTTSTEHELLDRIARLPREIRPLRDPWLDIAARLDEPAAVADTVPSPGWAMRAVAALAVAALALGIVFSGPDRVAPVPAAGTADLHAGAGTALRNPDFAPARLRGALEVGRVDRETAGGTPARRYTQDHVFQCGDRCGSGS